MEINPETLEIEIVDVEPIEGGIQVFVRAWSDGQQIGFGTDGTVDIERFRIFNPPILVADSNGDYIIQQEANEELGIPGYYQAFREDGEIATIESLAHTIKTMKNIHGPENIVPLKRGNTTSTFYPAAGAASPVDGQVNDNNGAATAVWSTFRDGGGDSAFPTNNPIVAAYLRSVTTSNLYNLMVRSFYKFDTSSIPDGDTVSSATLSLYCTAVSNTTAFGGLSLGVTTWTTASDSNLIAADYAITNIGTQVTAAKAFNTYTTSAYNDHALTNTSVVNKTGLTTLASLTTAEINNAAPTWQSNLTSSVTVSAADEAGTAQDPKLVVEHAGAATASNQYFTMMGIG